MGSGLDRRSTKRTQMAPEIAISNPVRTDEPQNLQGAFKAAMRRFAATVTIITVANGGVRSGMTATAVSSLSTDPMAMGNSSTSVSRSRWAGVCPSDMHNYLADGFTCCKTSDGLWGTLQRDLLGNAGLDTPFL